LTITTNGSFTYCIATGSLSGGVIGSFINIPTKCAHVEIEVPPGCYIVAATLSPGAPSTGTPTSLGNWISHIAIVRAECGDDECVTLFPPTFHFCGIWWITALQELVRQGAVDPEAGRAAGDAVQRVLGQIPMDPLTEQMQVLQPQRQG
jgi:hypothetical protein